jgi:protein gp37
MFKTKIEWTDYSWNPITGCLWDCWYCYAKKLFTRFHRSFKPQFHPERLDEPSKLKKPAKIFCCSVSDLFAYWTKEDWRHAVLERIKKYSTEKPFLTFQLLTKQPHNIDRNYKFPENTWVGATITEQDEIWKIEDLKKINAKIKFVSFEPLLGEIQTDLKGIDWIIIGKLTGSKKIPLKKEWVENLIRQAKKSEIPIFVKNNVKWGKKIQEFPQWGCPKEQDKGLQKRL